MKVRAVGVMLGLAAACSACGPAGDGPGETTLTVYAAASLEAPFTEIGEAFEADHEGVTVIFNFAGSSDLVAQLLQGAPADVFASADPATMDKAVADDLIAGTPVDFAANTLQIALPPDNPGDVDSLADLANPELDVVVCAPEVPCGAATREVEESSGVDISPVSEESSVTDVLNKVTTGEADAGLVYVTDVIKAGDSIEGLDFAESSSAVNTYPVAALREGDNRELADDFIDVVTGPQGQATLAGAGFATP